METTEKSLMPQMFAPVERKLFEGPAMGENGAAVQPSYQLSLAGYPWCLITGDCPHHGYQNRKR